MDDRRAGLSSAEAARRLATTGANVLPSPQRRGPLADLVGQVVHFFALMLWVASALAFVAGLPQLGVAIIVVIIVNGVFAFVQERRAERAAERLRELLPVGVTVRRDRHPTTIDASQVVPGDVLLLTAGDRIPADGVIVDASGVLVDESMLTGESVAVAPAVDDRARAGTFVVAGAAEVVVDATGSSTRLAGIAELTAGVQRPPSPLAVELDRIVRTVAMLAVGVGGSFFALSLLLGSPATDGFLFAVGVTVALVPEGLLPTVTLSLAMGAQRMARGNALVRHLEAVETLGSTTYICTDKTGTLTRNQMSVVEVWTPGGAVTVRGAGYAPEGEVIGDGVARTRATTVATAALGCSDGRIRADGIAWIPVGDPMEAAIHALVGRLDGAGAVAEEGERPRRRYAFDASRRRASALVGDALVVKGAPDAVLPVCRDEHGATDVVERMAAAGLRVLAVARRAAADVAEDATAEVAEKDLELLGLLAFLDPPRAEVTDALAACRNAGIRVAMVTGDHPATARAIASAVGLLVDGELVLEGGALPADEAVLGALLDRDGVVVSRVTPEDKLRITRALQARGHVVAMTGDGVNDGPALREADIGVAMGRSGTDVAREAADLVLLDDDFSTIVAAVEQGRATYANVRRFLTYHLTDNVAELTPFVVWALSGGRFPLALGVLQILCLDIGTDLLPALALGAEPPSAGVLDRPPERRHVIDRRLVARVFGVLGPAEAAVEMTAFVVALVVAGWRPGQAFPEGQALLAASGAAFIAVVVGQMANAFACRSASVWPGRLGWRSNRLLLWAVGVELLALVFFMVVPPVADLLDHAVPPPAALFVALLAAPAVLLVDALEKRRRHRRRGPTPAL
jgi:magnesium-transporting ATPase (P-type)